MKLSSKVFASALAGFAQLASALPSTGTKTVRAVSSVVSGSPVGFASGVTGGGTATPVYPSTVAQLKSYLTSSSPQVIVISKEFDFAGTEGTSTYTACNAYSCTPSNGGQALLNTLSGCGSKSTYSVTIDAAAYQGIQVKSDKTLVGTGTGAILNGKGLRFVGVSNIIVQNIKVTNLNPRYVWGGDALSFSDVSDIWIDHVTTSSLGRQHYSFGTGASTGITISNSFLDGRTAYSATCDNHTYWGMELVGSGDQITFYKNYVYYTSGRSPALSGTTLFHAVNNVWSTNSGHLIEGDKNGAGLYEGNYFLNDKTIVGSFTSGSLFSSYTSLTSCSTYLGRSCVANGYSGSGTFEFADTSFLSQFKSLTVATASAATAIQNSVPTAAGNTL